MERLLAVLALLPFGVGFSLGDAPIDGNPIFAFADPEIIESSGLLARDGLFATVNDSGDRGRVFTVEPSTGETVAETRWDAPPVDVEAMAPLPDGDLLVADIGDNPGSRPSVELIRVPAGLDGVVQPKTYELVYPDGAHDAESLLVHPETGQSFVVSKEFVGRMYAAPRKLSATSPNELELVGEVLPIATDGAFFPDGEHFVLRSYGGATFYQWPSLSEVGEIDLPSQPQGEGIAVDAEGAVFISSEGQFSEVLRVGLPRRLRAVLDGQPPPPASGVDGPTDPQTDPQTEDGTPAESTPEPAPEPAPGRVLWPWLMGGVMGMVIVVVLIRSLRPR